jgi:hypothetical protein
MWTLSETRTHLGNRLAEESTVFWSDDERDAAINHAQRLIATATHGVPATVTGPVSTGTNYLTTTGKVLGVYEHAGRVVGGPALSYAASMASANAIYPGWADAVGEPRWVMPAINESRVYLAPVPAVPVNVTVYVSVIPADVVGDSDPLFANATTMERYQGAVINLAAALLFLKERYEQDAERFWQLGLQEMQIAGTDSRRLPPMREAENG